jgi:hypothetical protein
MRMARLALLGALLLAAAVGLWTAADRQTRKETEPALTTGRKAPVNWRGLSSLPELPAEGFWAPDHPKEMDALAFGQLPAELPIYILRPQVGT